MTHVTATPVVVGIIAGVGLAVFVVGCLAVAAHFIRKHW
jgi:uncharacterized membrane protein